MKRLTVVFLWFAMGAVGSSVRAEDRTTQQGHLFIVGGGGIPDDAARHALEVAGGKNAHVVVLPHASQRPEAGDESAEYWRNLGAVHVQIVHPEASEGESSDQSRREPESPEDATDSSVRHIHSALGVLEAEAILRTATLIWMSGGDQNRLMDALNRAGLCDDLHHRYREGAVIGGTSAGAAVMSKIMITGESNLGRIAHDCNAFADGLGLWPEAIVDQHFVRRARFNRLMSLVLERPTLIGVGIDEQTAVWVSGTTFQVWGAGQVVVIDARAASEIRAGDVSPFAARNLSIHVLRAGDSFICRH
jgi:cyanophycinase